MTLVFLSGNDSPPVVARAAAASAERESHMRDLIHDHPEVLPVHSLDPSFGRVFAVAKELSIPGVGFVDVLLADERGRLIIAECKLWRNPQARREVIGQIIDYARELSRWGYEDLQRQISARQRRGGNVLYELARDAGSDLDEASFVDRVSRDLQAGRFLLLVVGDGITEGTRRIGEYLRDQPGLAFEFGLIEMAEYHYTDEGGHERTIVQPRVLAQTATIERHVIRAEVPGLVIEAAAEETVAASIARGPSDAGLAWRAFAERFAAEAQFDDPGQPAPRSGGMGWIKLPLPGGYYVNLHRTQGDQRIGAQVRFTCGEGQAIYADLAADREAIDREFTEAGLPAPEWRDGDAPIIVLSTGSALPWDEVREDAQRAWFAAAGNQFVNSMRPRLQRLTGN